MRNRRAFTLIELLATLVIIAALGVIVTPKVLDIISSNRNKAYYEIEQRLEENAAKYIVDKYLSSDETLTIITKEELINEGYIEEVYDLKDNTICDAYVYAYNLNNNAKFEATLNCSSYQTKNKNAVGYINYLLKVENRLNNGLKQTTVLVNDETKDAGIRYTGSNPNNKVYFNCEAKDKNNVSYGEEGYLYKESCEEWRIIGVFNVLDGSGNIEKRMKIINTESTFMASWDSSRYVSSTDHVNNGGGINQWGASKYSNGSSYEGADLMRLLNGYYIGKSGSTCRYCNGENQETCEQICDTQDNTLASQKMKPLTSIAKSMTKNAVWDTYAVYYEDDELPSDGYLREKGITAQHTGKSRCIANGGGTYCNDNVERTTSWTGLVGLMSQYDIWTANGWLYDPGTNIYPWSISPLAHSDYANGVWLAYSGGAVDSNVRDSHAVWPTVYLSSNIKIIDGDGNNTPYKLSI